MHSIHKFKVEGISGDDIDLSRFAGKKMIVVNVASECGYTPQYGQLQELYEHYKEKLAIIGFPSNDFGGQEPGSEKEIAQFCQKNYGVSFPLTAKVSVRGAHPHPVFSWLTDARLNGVQSSTPSWNFQKYLLNESGQLVSVLPSSVSPFDEKVIDWLENN